MVERNESNRQLEQPPVGEVLPGAPEGPGKTPKKRSLMKALIFGRNKWITRGVGGALLSAAAAAAIVGTCSLRQGVEGITEEAGTATQVPSPAAGTLTPEALPTQIPAGPTAIPIVAPSADDVTAAYYAQEAAAKALATAVAALEKLYRTPTSAPVVIDTSRSEETAVPIVTPRSTATATKTPEPTATQTAKPTVAPTATETATATETPEVKASLRFGLIVDGTGKYKLFDRDTKSIMDPATLPPATIIRQSATGARNTLTVQDMPVLPNQIAIVEGRIVNGRHGVFTAVENPSHSRDIIYPRFTITDGAFTVVSSEEGPVLFAQTVNRAVAKGLAHDHVIPLPGWMVGK